MSFNNRSKSYFDANGFAIRDINDYNSYINDVKNFILLQVILNIGFMTFIIQQHQQIIKEIPLFLNLI
jgi:hypothetical protein